MRGAPGVHLMREGAAGQSQVNEPTQVMAHANTLGRWLLRCERSAVLCLSAPPLRPHCHRDRDTKSVCAVDSDNCMNAHLVACVVPHLLAILLRRTHALHQLISLKGSQPHQAVALLWPGSARAAIVHQLVRALPVACLRGQPRSTQAATRPGSFDNSSLQCCSYDPCTHPPLPEPRHAPPVACVHSSLP